MKFGIVSANSGPRTHPDEAVAFAHLVEELGFESLWTVEHVAIPARRASPYPYSDNGTMPGGDSLPMSDPLIWMAYVAAATTTLRLGTGVLVLPLNHPVRLAKAAATLDVLSGGRLILGLGVGWLAEEADLLDAPWAERGVRSEEQIEVLRALWRDDVASYHGRFYDLDGVHSWPKPHQPGGVPIVLGGHSDVVARRAGRLADGFMPAPADLPSITALVATMRAAAAECGRDPDEVEVTCARVNDLDTALALADLGVARCNILPPRSPDTARARLETYRERVIDPLTARGL